MLKKQNGITLIALIITVIVMLILVGVTINVALNGGLFEKAETATRETEEKAILEEMLAMMEIDNNGKFMYDTIISNMRINHPEYDVKYNYPNATIMGKLGTYNYIVSETEIKIGESNVPPPVDTDFEKYILGVDKTGRPISEITVTTDMRTFTFIDDELTPDIDETETLNVQFLISGQNENNKKYFIYAKYDDKAYKITMDRTYKSEKLEVIYEPKGREGQTTADGWTILYDNGTTVEAVSPTAMGSLRLGYSATATDSATQLTEAIDSYNNAITTINNYCKNELTGLPTNTGVRSVGASSETNEYYSDIPESWNSAYNEVGKKGDILYEQDLVRMAYHEVHATGEIYWMASRTAFGGTGQVGFKVYCVFSDGTLNYYRDLWIVTSSDFARGDHYTYAVRPIITIQNP